MKKLLITSALIFSVSVGNGGILDGVTNSVTNGVVNSSTGDLSKMFSLDTLTSGELNSIKNKASSFALKSIQSSMGGMVGSNMILDMCYTYGSGSSNFSLNPCDLLGAGANPCASAPNLSSFGYKKKTSTYDLEEYCRSLGYSINTGGITATGNTSVPKSPTANKSINQNIKKINSSTVLKDKYAKVKANSVKNSSGGGGGGSGGSKGGKSTANVVNTGDKKIEGSSISLANNKDNVEMQKVYYQNNYQGYSLVKDGLLASDETVENVDLSKISGGYNTLDEYNESVNDLINTFTLNDTYINLTYLKNTANSAFQKINTETTNVSEQESLKETEASNMIVKYTEQMDIWKVSEMQKRLWLLVKETEQVVSPTEDLLDSTNDVKTRINMVYFGEKNKNERAKILADVEIQAFDMIEKAKNIIQMARINSRTFDRTTEYNAILSTLSSIQ